MTTTTLNGKLQGLDVEEGSEKQSKLLEAFSAWVMEDEDEEMPDNDFLFTHVSRSRKGKWVDPGPLFPRPSNIEVKKAFMKLSDLIV